MRNNIKWLNIIIPFIIVLALVSMGLVLYTLSYDQRDTPEYTTHNSDKNGIKGIYLLCERLGYQVSRYIMPAKFLNEDGIMVIYRPESNFFMDKDEREGIKKWINKGNDLLFIPDNNVNLYWLEEYISANRDGHEVVCDDKTTVHAYLVNKSTIYILESINDITNDNLGDYENGIAFIRVLEHSKKINVIFNEFYHGIQRPAPSIWQLFGETGQLVILQIVLVSIILLVSGWKTFGIPKKRKENEARIENENMFALANIYGRTKSYSLVLKNHLDNVYDSLRKYLGFSNTVEHSVICEMAGKDKRLEKVNARQVLYACEKYIKDNTRNKKLLIMLVKRLEKINYEIWGD